MAAANAESVKDHWYWRPGWGIGTRFYTWHITFADKPEIVAFAGRYRDRLSEEPMLDVVPDQWLHLTMQGIGFVTSVSLDDVNAIALAARKRCAALAPFRLTLDKPYVDPESIQIAVQPPDPVRQLRAELRAAIADVWGDNHVPEPASPYTPHMSLAYVNSDGPAGPLAQAINSVTEAAASATIDSCQLIVLNRDPGMYVWEPFTTVAIGQ